MREDLVHFAELVSLAVSAGLGVEGALDQAAGSGEGPLFDELRRLLREGRLRGESASATISRLPAEVGTRRRGVRSPRRSGRPPTTAPPSRRPSGLRRAPSGSGGGWSWWKRPSEPRSGCCFPLGS